MKESTEKFGEKLATENLVGVREKSILCLSIPEVGAICKKCIYRQSPIFVSLTKNFLLVSSSNHGNFSPFPDMLPTFQ